MAQNQGAIHVLWNMSGKNNFLFEGMEGAFYRIVVGNAPRSIASEPHYIFSAGSEIDWRKDAKGNVFIDIVDPKTNDVFSFQTPLTVKQLNDIADGRAGSPTEFTKATVRRMLDDAIERLRDAGYELSLPNAKPALV